jgi:uncharacterized damage-inducible protein DinB
MSRAELIERYLDGPAKLRAAIGGMTAEQLRARPVEGKWSTAEVVCHIADFEPILADRMKRIITHDRPALLGADENLFASGLAYHDRDLDREIDLIDLTRRQLAVILRKLPSASWERVGVHSERGEMSLEKLLTGAANHIEHHLTFVAAKKAALGIG